VIAFCSTTGFATPSDGQVIGTVKIVDNGSAAERFNLVLIAEGYQSSEQNLFQQHAQDFVDFFFQQPPFPDAQSAFNIWRIDVTSTDSGADDPAACGGTGAVVNTYFDASFCWGGSGIRRLLYVNSTTAHNVLDDQVPEWDQALVIVNSTIYGGAGGTIGVTSVSGTWQNIAIHELGHSAFGLADEYPYYAGCGIDTDRDHYTDPEPVEPNVTIETVRELIKWNNLILADTPVPTTINPDCTQCDWQNPYPGQVVVGLYEGAYYHHCDVYRPAYGCKMLALGYDFCPVCAQRILQVLDPYMDHCWCDLEPAVGDKDVDGADLAAYIADRGEISVADFAAEFGRIDCP
jgi:hypothetical protein